MKKQHLIYLAFMLLIAVSSACRKADITQEITGTVSDYADWTEATHSNDVGPNFQEVFDDTMVKRLDFVVTTKRWQRMLDDMTATYGAFGSDTGRDPGGPGGPRRSGRSRRRWPN